MAGTATDLTGATVAFGTSTWQAQLLSISWTGLERQEIKSSHMGTTGYHTYIPADLVEPGQIELEYYHDGTDNVGTLLAAAAETVTINWRTGVSWAASCFAKNADANAKMGEAGIQTIILKPTGTITMDVTP